ncbi:hypothetical protein K7X08_006603 [Anisodus acutangulus]|uniref:Uncharacterized protein n=1 Tax=Anisodus acutangulus TaxID=402998 RepID=A0A9Q1RRL1_9SOLA|nr:hypothetical protein K7X08_006603 [Anisodus acutangulus]
MCTVLPISSHLNTDLIRKNQRLFLELFNKRELEIWVVESAMEEGKAINREPASKPAVSATVDATKQIPAGIQSTALKNRGDCQNTGNFITERPSTKIHAAPGGGSSLGYLFGDGSS